MKKENLFRTIFWGFITLICLTCAVSGLIYNNILFKNRETDLKNIVEVFNNTKVIKNYESVNTSIIARLDGKNIKISYEGVEIKEYKYKLKNGYLQTELENNDAIGKIILMVLADSIAINKGQNEGEIYTLFNNDTVLTYKLSEGIEYKEKDNYSIIKLNLDKHILRQETDEIIDDTPNINEDNENIENDDADDTLENDDTL